MKGKPSKGKCLTDDEAAAYADGSARPDLRRRIEDHLARCNACLHGVAELKQLLRPAASGQAAGAALPARVLARAEDIIERSTAAVPEMAITLTVKAGLCTILHTTGRLLAPAQLAPVRSGDAPRGRPTVTESLSGHLVTLELATKERRAQPKLMIMRESSSIRPDGVKAVISSGGVRQTRYTRSGRASFTPLGPGVSIIEIEDIGRIRIEVQ
jgi:anti-sigma factor RsiW